MKNKKGGIDPSTVIFLVFTVGVLVAFVPIYLTLVDDADASVLTCDDSATPILNTSLSLCTNASGVGVVNATPSESGLTATEETMMGLTVMFFILGLVFIVLNKTGVVKSGS